LRARLATALVRVGHRLDPTRLSCTRAKTRSSKAAWPHTSASLPSGRRLRPLWRPAGDY
jgi:hypothetical protein